MTLLRKFARYCLRLPVLGLIGMLALQAPSFAGATSSLWPVCFSHIGPQDKPMPEFCLVALDQPLPKAEVVRPRLSVTDKARQDVVDLCRQAPAPQTDNQQGTFRVWTRGDESAAGCSFGPETMRRILAIVQGDFAARGEPLPDVIQMLQNRLATGN